MNPRRSLLLVSLVCVTAVAWFGSAHSARAAAPSMPEQRITCPARMPADAFKPANTPPGWTAAMPEDWPLGVGGGLLWGPPEESAYLKPSEANVGRAGAIETGTTRWRLSVPHGFEVWAACAYGPLFLFKRVDPRATECKAITKGERSGALMEQSFVCK